jgi:hypothetical protein
MDSFRSGTTRFSLAVVFRTTLFAGTEVVDFLLETCIAVFSFYQKRIFLRVLAGMPPTRGADHMIQARAPLFAGNINMRNQRKCEQLAKV